MSSHPSTFRDTVRHLRVLVPPVWPVSVRRAKLGDDVHGYCSLSTQGKSPRYLIRVSAELSDETQVYVLIHEWAHALSWASDSHRIRHHAPEWGLAMSRIWQALKED